MVRILASSAVDRWHEPQSGHTEDYKIGMCWFSAKHAVLTRIAQTCWDNVFKWGDMSIRGLLFQWASTIKIKLSVLV
jgi:hypothetical protein